MSCEQPQIAAMECGAVKFCKRLRPAITKSLLLVRVRRVAVFVCNAGVRCGRRRSGG